MNVTVERTGPDEALVEIQVEAERVDRAVGEALRHLAQRYVFPGFRKGKAPRTIVESFLGRDAIYQDALQHLVEATFDEAVDQEGLRPVAGADLEEDVDLREGEPLVFKARVKVRPEIAFGPLDNLSVDVEAQPVGDEAVEAFLVSLRRQHARLKEADTVTEHAMVRAEVSTSVGGEVIEQPREGVLDMEEGDPVITDLASSLAGTAVGETREVVWTIPSDHPQHAGKEAVTRIHVLEVRDRELPALDDELARHAGAESVEDLRKRARTYLEDQERGRFQRARLDAAVNALVDRTDVAVPEPLVERQTDILWREFLAELRRQRIPLEAYRAAAGKDEAAVREGFRPQAERRAKRNMLLEALAETQGLVPLEGEIRANADRLLGAPEKGPKDTKRTLSRGQRAYVRDVLLREKALAHLAGMYAPGNIEDVAEAAEALADADDPEAGQAG